MTGHDMSLACSSPHAARGEQAKSPLFLLGSRLSVKLSSASTLDLAISPLFHSPTLPYRTVRRGAGISHVIINHNNGRSLD